MNIIFSFLLMAVGCPCDSLPAGKWQTRPDFEKHYRAANVSGAFVLYDLKNDSHLVYNRARVETPFVPASTFKILNALIALETGVIKDENEIFK